MSDLKESIQVNVQEVVLGLQEKSFNLLTEFRSWPKWKQIFLFVLCIAIPLVYLGARLGVEQYYTQQFARQALSAQAVFGFSQRPIFSKMQIIKNPNGTFSAVVQVSNPNLDLSANNIEYTAIFRTNDTPIEIKGTFFLLPNDKKYLVFPRLETSSSNVVSGEIKLTQQVDWQKRINVPDVNIKTSEPVLYDVSNPLSFVAEGSIVNSSPYDIRSVRIVFLIYDTKGQVIGVSQRDESTLLPFGRRAYKQQWPGVYRSQVGKIQVLPEVNTLEPNNLTIHPSSQASSNDKQSTQE